MQEAFEESPAIEGYIGISTVPSWTFLMDTRRCAQKTRVGRLSSVLQGRVLRGGRSMAMATKAFLFWPGQILRLFGRVGLFIYLFLMVVWIIWVEVVDGRYST